MCLCHDSQGAILRHVSNKRTTLCTPVRDILSILPRSLFLGVDGKVTIGQDRVMGVNGSNICAVSSNHAFRKHGHNLDDRHHLHVRVKLSSAGLHPVDVDLLRGYDLLSSVPLTFYIVRLIFGRSKHNISFVFHCYGTRVTGVRNIPIRRVLSHSFCGIFPGKSGG